MITVCQSTVRQSQREAIVLPSFLLCEYDDGMEMRMRDKLTLINKNTLESLEERDLVSIVERFVQTGTQILAADFGFMFWKTEAKGPFKLIYKTQETPYQPRLPRKKGYNYVASKIRTPYFVTNPIKAVLPHMKSLAVIPIFYKHHQYGTIVLCFKKKRTFTREEEPLMVTFGNAAAQVLTIFRIHKRSESSYVRQLRQKDEFFNMVSHELRTPLTTIKGAAQLLDGLWKHADPKTKSLLDKINTQADRLGRLINDMLDVSQVQVGKLLFEEHDFELQKLLRHTIAGLKVSITSHPISFKGTGQLWVHGDSHRLEAVLINLISNAAKYSPPGSRIKVSARKENDFARVEVEDFGYGVSEKDRAKIFSRFYQSKHTVGLHIPGLGLGLYIANAIVKHHGGTLDLISKSEAPGSIFFFTLPCRGKQEKSKTIS